MEAATEVVAESIKEVKAKRSHTKTQKWLDSRHECKECGQNHFIKKK